MFRHQLISPRTPKQPMLCRECGCNCHSCESNSLDWHHKIEELKAKLVDATTRLTQSEHELVDTRCRADQDTLRLQDELAKLRDRYDRLYESHKKLQKVNNDLEDKLISVVSKLELEKAELLESLASIQSKLTDTETAVEYLEDECDRLKSDCTIAVQLLHCRPSDFISYKLNELPVTLQERVRNQLTPKELLELEAESDVADTSGNIRVPIPTFPPTAVSYVRPVDAVTTTPTFENTLRRVNTVPMSLVARALLPSSPADDTAIARRRHGDAYVCASCRRCDSAVDGTAGKRVHMTADSGQIVECSVDMSVSGTASPGIHTARQSSSQAVLFRLQCS